jgi:hypothetical protein
MDRRAWKEPLDQQILCEAIPIARGDLLGVRRGCGAVVFVQSGVIWLTQENAPQDVILRSGEWFRLNRDGLALLHAHTAAAVTVTAMNNLAEIEIYRAGRSVCIATPRRHGHPLVRNILAWWFRMHRLGRRAVTARAR